MLNFSNEVKIIVYFINLRSQCCIFEFSSRFCLIKGAHIHFKLFPFCSSNLKNFFGYWQTYHTFPSLISTWPDWNCSSSWTPTITLLTFVFSVLVICFFHLSPESFFYCFYKYVIFLILSGWFWIISWFFHPPWLYPFYFSFIVIKTLWFFLTLVNFLIFVVS